MNPLPPQAYTKDTLLNAYAWLQHQSDPIKEMARTPDILVSLYLKANRDGDAALDRPSIHNFKNELKHLASMMGELDKPQVQLAPQMSKSAQTLNPVMIGQPQKAPLSDLQMNLDEKSLAMIREVKEDFNLTSDIEALRMVIKVGYTRAKTLLK